MDLQYLIIYVYSPFLQNDKQMHLLTRALYRHEIYGNATKQYIIHCMDTIITVVVTGNKNKLSNL